MEIGKKPLTTFTLSFPPFTSILCFLNFLPVYIWPPSLLVSSLASLLFGHLCFSVNPILTASFSHVPPPSLLPSLPLSHLLLIPPPSLHPSPSFPFHFFILPHSLPHITLPPSLSLSSLVNLTQLVLMKTAGQSISSSAPVLRLVENRTVSHAAALSLPPSLAAQHVVFRECIGSV